MATLKKVSGTDITYLFNGSYQQLYATMIRFPLGEQKAKMFAEVDANSNSDIIMWKKPYDGNIDYHCVETSPEKDVLIMLWSKREKEIRSLLAQAKVSKIDDLLTFPDYSYLYYTINEDADADVPEKKYNLVLTGWGCQRGIEIHKGSDDASQQKKEAENKHQEVIVHLVDESNSPLVNHNFTYSYNNGVPYPFNSNNGTLNLGLCLIDSLLVFHDNETDFEQSFHVKKGQSEYTLVFTSKIGDPGPGSSGSVVKEGPEGPGTPEGPEGPEGPEDPITRYVKVITESRQIIPFYSLELSSNEYVQEKISNSEGLIELPEQINTQPLFKAYDELSGKEETYAITDETEYIFIVPEKKPLQDVNIRVINQKGAPIADFPITVQYGQQLEDVFTDAHGVHHVGELQVDDEFMVACTNAKHINQKYVVEKGKDEYIFQIEEELSPITVELQNKQKTPLPGASLTLTNAKGEQFQHYTDENGQIVVPRSFFTDKEDIHVHMEIADSNVKDCKFKFEDDCSYYVITIKDPFPWKKLLYLLALLLLCALLFVRCNKDITVKVVEAGDAAVSGAQVEMSYTEHQLYKNNIFFYSSTHVNNGVTDSAGYVTFEKQPCSVFSYIFYSFSKANASANKNGRHGAGSFFFHWQLTPYVIFLETEINIQVVDANTQRPIPGASVQLWSADLNFDQYTLTTNAQGMCSFVSARENADFEKILVTANGYSGSLMYDVELQQLNNAVIPLNPPSTCEVQVDNGNRDQGNHAIRDFNMGQQGGSFLLEYFTDSHPDHIMIYDGTSSDYSASKAKLIFDFDGATNTTYYAHSQYVTFTSSYVCVVVDNGSNWGYYLHCPQ